MEIAFEIFMNASEETGERGKGRTLKSITSMMRK
jgi:hypothetical protein